MTEPSDAFGLKLKELRAVAGLTQAELAERAGMNQFGVAKLEQGKTSPSWGTVVALCRALGVKCDEFMEPPAAGSGPAKPGRPPSQASAEVTSRRPRRKSK